MKSTRQNPFNGLVEVSDTRRKFLDEWLFERALDLKLRSIEEADERADAVADGEAVADWPEPAAFDKAIEVGDIRLLSGSLTTDPLRMAYVGVLEVEGMYALVAPFSIYDYPASKGEWLTGIDATPLHVLQLWNAQPVPVLMLAKSWKVGSFTREELASARTLYRHTVAGTWPPAELRESIGLAIHSPDDVRVDYQDEELEMFAPLRASTFRLQQELEEHADYIRSRGVMTLIREWKPPVLAAAADGTVIAPVLLLRADGTECSLTAERLEHSYEPGEGYDSRWMIRGWTDAVPGLPVFAYASREALAQGGEALAFDATYGAEGNRVVFQGEREDEFAQLSAKELVLLVREVQHVD